jgi:hypothetical protein
MAPGAVGRLAAQKDESALLEAEPAAELPVAVVANYFAQAQGFLAVAGHSHPAVPEAEVACY